MLLPDLRAKTEPLLPPTAHTNSCANRAQASSRAEPVVRLDSVEVRFGTRTAVSGVDGNLPSGHALALVGPNGAGKTTVLRVLAGLIRPTAGEVEVLGRAPGSTKGDVAYVPQTDTLDSTFPVSAAEVVLMGRFRRVGWVRRPGRADRKLAAEALERVGMDHRACDPFGELSGGQRQRVLLARAIAQQAPLLLLDEPFNGVDSTTTEILLDVLHDLRKEGTTLVLSIHDIHIARHCCTDACLLRTEQVAHGPTADILVPKYLTLAYGESALIAQHSTDPDNANLLRD